MKDLHFIYLVWLIHSYIPITPVCLNVLYTIALLTSQELFKLLVLSISVKWYDYEYITHSLNLSDLYMMHLMVPTQIVDLRSNTYNIEYIIIF